MRLWVCISAEAAGALPMPVGSSVPQVSGTAVARSGRSDRSRKPAWPPCGAVSITRHPGSTDAEGFPLGGSSNADSTSRTASMVLPDPAGPDPDPAAAPAGASPGAPPPGGQGLQ